MTDKESMLTASRLRDLLSYDPLSGVFTWLRRSSDKSWVVPGSAAGYVTNGYVSITVGGYPYQAHRLAVLHQTGEWPTGEIDHINMDRADNRWANLREATPAQNQWNTRVRPDNTSGYKGSTGRETR